MQTENTSEGHIEFEPRDVDKGHVRNQDYMEAVTSEMTGFDKQMIKDIFNACWQTICDELEHGNTVKLHGKGQFYLSRRARRMGRNPATGEEHIVPEREAMAFHTSPAYARRLRERRIALTGRNESPEPLETEGESEDE